MPSLKGKEYKRFEDIKHIRDDGSEYWSARDIQQIEKEQMERLQKKAKAGKLMLDE